MAASMLHPRYAKLSPPRVHEALVRERLLDALDARRARHQVLWIASPPGAGKTTLVATYLAGRSPAALWYQVDPGDADPATFFYYLAKLLPEITLPWLAPESSDVPNFARLFFREFYAHLAVGTVLVFDNFQEFDWDSWGEIAEIALTEVPSGITVLVVSRDAPHERLTKLRLDKKLSVLNWEMIRFNQEEAIALAQLDEGAAEEDLAWLEQVDGWAAGVVMLREHAAHHPAPRSAPSLDSRDAIFSYFASEILAQMPRAHQHDLLMLSYLPGISAADAEQLTGHQAASKLLQRLYQNRSFVDRRGDDVPTYHFHALFREFLQHEAQQRLEVAERTTLLEQAAVILDHQERTEEAVQLYRDAGAWSVLANLLRRRAHDMHVSGRGKTWREWLSWLPAGSVDTDPWLLYWQGTFLNTLAPSKARDVLEKAERVFQGVGDIPGRLLAISGIVDNFLTYYGSSDFRTLQHWANIMIAELQSLPAGELEPDDSLQIHTRLSIALSFAAPDSKALRSSIERIVEFLPLSGHKSDRLAAGGTVLHCINWMDIGAARWLIDLLQGEAAQSLASPSSRMWWYFQVARWQLDTEGNVDGAQAAIDAAVSVVTDYGLVAKDWLHLHFTNALISIATNNLPRAQNLIKELHGIVSGARKGDQFRLAVTQILYLAQAGDTAEALRLAHLTYSAAVERGAVNVDRARFESMVAGCHALAGDFAQAGKWYAQAIGHAYGAEVEATAQARQFVAALASAAAGEKDKAAGLLTDAFVQHKQRQQYGLFVRLPRLASKVAALALEHDVEADLVAEIIRRQKLAPPDFLVQNWPWPVVVRTLGKAELALHGNLVKFAGRGQQKPIELLKALISAGPAGRTQQFLADALWTDAANVKSSLNVTIHRLRKFLGSDEAIRVEGGKLRVDEKIVWSDVAALTRLCERIESLPDAPSQADIEFLAAKLLEIYRGPFGDGEDEPWLAPARDRYRNRFLAAATKLGALLESREQWAVAKELYLRALESEPLAETIYRGLMRCSHAQHDPAAAYSIYRRCRDMLSIVASRKPSAETERLVSELGLLAK